MGIFIGFYLGIVFFLWIITIMCLVYDDKELLKIIYGVSNKWIILFGLLFPIFIPLLFLISLVIKLIRE